MRKALLSVLSVFVCAVCQAVASDIDLVNTTMEAADDQADAPDGWEATYPEQHTLQRYACRSEGAAWMFWYEGTIRQSLRGEFPADAKVRFGGYLCTPSDDPLRHGTKCGKVWLICYADTDGDKKLSKVLARPIVAEGSPHGEWIRSQGIAVIPRGTQRIDFVVSCEEGKTGDGSFFFDDAFIEWMD